MATPKPEIRLAPVPRLALTASEAAAACGLSVEVFESLVDAGKVPFVEVEGEVVLPVHLLRDALHKHARLKQVPPRR